MRWFKHMSMSNTDEVLAELADTFGAEGYGVWWFILEKIAQIMDESDRTYARFSLKFWASFARVSVKKFQSITEFLENRGSFSLKRDGNYLTIDCPNLLKYRDEWTERQSKKEKKKRELLGSKSGETPVTEAETEAEKENEKANAVALSFSCSEQKTFAHELDKKNTNEQMEIILTAEKSKNDKIENKVRTGDDDTTTLPTYQEKEIVALELNTGQQYPIFQSSIDEWAELYPAVDILQELRKMKGWLSGNIKRRKTKRGIKRFIVDWLARAQDNSKSINNALTDNKGYSYNNTKNITNGHCQDAENIKQEVMRLYNESIQGFKHCCPAIRMSNIDISNLQAIIDSDQTYKEPENWRNFFEYTRRLDKLMGQAQLSNSEYFKVSLSYILEDKNFTNINNGRWE